MVGGNDILSYQGNAALGLGPNVSELGSDEGTKALTDRLNKVVDDNLQDVQKNAIIKYRQGIEDRDRSLKLFMDQGVPADINSKDRPEVEAAYKKIQDAYLANPNFISDPEKAKEMAVSMNNLKYKSALAKTRENEFAKQRLEIANETDPLLKEERQKHYDEQLNAGLNQNPVPFINPFDRDRLLYPEIPTKDLGIITDANGVGYHRVQDNIPAILESYNPKTWISTNPYLPQRAAEEYARVLAHPNMDNSTFEAANAKIDALNKAYGLQPSNPNYIQPLGIKADDGNYKPNTNPIEFFKSLNVSRATPEVRLVNDKGAQDIAASAANIRKEETDSAIKKQEEPVNIALKKSQIAQNYAELQKTKAETEKIKRNLDDNEDDTKNAQTVIDESNKAVSEATKGNFKPVNAEVGQMLGIAPVTKENLGKVVAGGQAGAKGYTYTEIPADNRTMQGILTNYATVGDKRVLVNPTKMYAVKDPQGNISLVSTHMVTVTKNKEVTQKPEVLKRINVDDAPKELVDNIYNYNAGEKGLNIITQIKRLKPSVTKTGATIPPDYRHISTVKGVEIYRAPNGDYYTKTPDGELKFTQAATNPTK